MTPGGCDLGAQTPQTTVLTGVPSSPRTASCAPPAPSAGKSCEGFPPGGCFYCLEKEALGFNTSRSSRLPSARADARGTGASAASSAAVPAPPPGPAPHPWVGAHPGPGFLPQPPVLPDGFAQPLLCRPGACFPQGRADLEPGAAYSPAALMLSAPARPYALSAA